MYQISIDGLKETIISNQNYGAHQIALHMFNQSFAEDLYKQLPEELYLNYLDQNENFYVFLLQSKDFDINVTLPINKNEETIKYKKWIDEKRFTELLVFHPDIEGRDVQFEKSIRLLR